MGDKKRSSETAARPSKPEPEFLAKIDREVESDKVESSLWLWMSNGLVAKNMNDLISSIRQMETPAFTVHVNAMQNDIADWVSEILEMPKVANDLRKTTERKKTLEILEKALHAPSKSRAKEIIAAPKNIFQRTAQRMAGIRRGKQPLPPPPPLEGIPKLTSASIMQKMETVKSTTAVGRKTATVKMRPSVAKIPAGSRPVKGKPLIAPARRLLKQKELPAPRAQALKKPSIGAKRLPVTAFKKRATKAGTGRLKASSRHAVKIGARSLKGPSTARQKKLFKPRISGKGPLKSTRRPLPRTTGGRLKQRWIAARPAAITGAGKPSAPKRAISAPSKLPEPHLIRESDLPAPKQITERWLKQQHSLLDEEEERLNDDEEKLNNLRIKLAKRRYDLVKKRGELDRQLFEMFVKKHAAKTVEAPPPHLVNTREELRALVSTAQSLLKKGRVQDAQQALEDIRSGFSSGLLTGDDRRKMEYDIMEIETDIKLATLN